jgi:hypothetical protein
MVTSQLAHELWLLVANGRTQRQHTVTYDDGDVRNYDMTNRDFQILMTASKGEQSGGSDNEAGAAHLFASRPPAAQSYGLSCYLVENINVFGNLGGFTSILMRLHASVEDPTPGGPPVPPVPSFLTLRSYFRLFHIIRARLEPVILQKLLYDFKEVAPAILLRLSKTRLPPAHVDDVHDGWCWAPGDDQVKQITRLDVQDLQNMLNDMLLSLMVPRAQVLLAVDTFQLALAGKLFRTSQLEKRLSGLTLLKDMIAKTTLSRLQQVGGVGTWSQSVATFSKANTRPAPALDEEFLLRWLVRMEVVEELFGSRMHVDLVTRSEDVLRFMATRGAIKNVHLEAIWVRSLGRCHASSFSPWG